MGMDDTDVDGIVGDTLDRLDVPRSEGVVCCTEIPTELVGMFAWEVTLGNAVPDTEIVVADGEPRPGWDKDGLVAPGRLAVEETNAPLGGMMLVDVLGRPAGDVAETETEPRLGCETVERP